MHEAYEIGFEEHVELILPFPSFLHQILFHIHRIKFAFHWTQLVLHCADAGRSHSCIF